MSAEANKHVETMEEALQRCGAILADTRTLDFVKRCLAAGSDAQVLLHCHKTQEGRVCIYVSARAKTPGVQIVQFCGLTFEQEGQG
jgi:hypothetical protein